MKKSGTWIFAIIVTLFAGFLVGLLAGRSVQAGMVEISPLLQQANAAPTAKGTLVPAESATNEPAVQSATVSGQKININTATLEELETLPGIGPSIAQRIIDYRTEHGGFRNIYELINVSGIGEKKLIALLDYITVEDENEDFSS